MAKLPKGQSVVPMPPFRAFLADNIPAVYDNTMSYYDELTALIKYLQDTVVPALNADSEAITVLSNFVEHYFDNLDVQEEINNKLDQMAEDGTLQEIVASYLSAGAVWGFDTVADMKAATNLIDGSYARTLGYAELNDGGSALYKIRTPAVGDVADEKLLVAVGDLVAELITGDKVNVCQIGGQTDVGAACNYLIGKGKSVYIPNGSYTTATTIVLNQDYKEFICDGDIEFTGTNSVFIQAQCQYNVIKLNGKYTCGDTNVFMELGSSSKIVTNNTLFINRVESCKIGLWFTPSNARGVQYLDCTFSRITSAEKGIYFNPSDVGANWVNESTFRGGSLQGPYGIVTRKGAQQTDQFNGLKFEHVSFNGTITLPIDVEYMRESWFNELRINEGLVGDYIIKLDNCDYVTIENQHQIWLNKISVTNSTSLNIPIIIKAPRIRDASDNYIGTEVHYIANQAVFSQENTYSYGNVRLDGYLGSGGTTPSFNDPEYYYDNMLVRIGASDDNLTLSYQLPPAFRGLHSFYIVLQYKKANTSITVKTPGNTNIVTFGTGELIDKKIYYCERGGTISTAGVTLGEWKVTEVTTL